MIIVDKACRPGRTPAIRYAYVVGAGFAGRGFVHQVLQATPGMDVAVVANRTLTEAAKAFTDIGIDDFVSVSSAAQLAAAIERGQRAITDDPMLVTAADGIECIVEATGRSSSAQTAVSAIDHGKHLVLLNAELDCTLGPILKVRADAAGVVFTDADGDQPGVIMNLAREAEMMGFTPVVLGNIKSLMDHRRTPETQAGFAANVFQRPKHITSFADGTKIGRNMRTANAPGFGVSERGWPAPRPSGSKRRLACSRPRSCSRKARASSTSSSVPSPASECSYSPTATRGSTSAT